VILACQDVDEVRCAQQWTAALTRWCERQPELVAVTGPCLMHRAEIVQLHRACAKGLPVGTVSRRALPAGRVRAGGRRGVPSPQALVAECSPP
jgi:hypothetical protein